MCVFIVVVLSMNKTSSLMLSQGHIESHIALMSDMDENLGCGTRSGP